ncbi:hypothetical protein GCM10027452_30630 [Micromonospora halotolerans]
MFAVDTVGRHGTAGRDRRDFVHKGRTGGRSPAAPRAARFVTRTPLLGSVHLSRRETDVCPAVPWAGAGGTIAQESTPDRD